MSKTAVLLIAHGSREAAAIDQLPLLTSDAPPPKARK